MALKPVLFALVALAGLTACGDREDNPAIDAGRNLIREIGGRTGPSAPAIDLRTIFTPDVINEAATPLIYLDLGAAGAEAIFWRIATNGPNETWRGEPEVSVTLSRDGVLRATRGFANDLYASDIEGTRAALANRRAGQVQRLAVRVGGDLEELRIGYTCDIGFAAPETVTIFGTARTLTPASERCRDASGTEAFENRYWIDGTGFVWASEQWVSAEIGHFRIERLYR